MSIVINSNFAASAASYNLNQTSANLRRSLERLSSGSRINSSSDDAAGLAVSMKLASALRRNVAAEANIGNAMSMLETQDSVLKIATKVVSRLSELATLAMDVTKNDGDIANYNSEFQSLRTQLAHLGREMFNGVSLFVQKSQDATPASSTARTITAVTSEDGAQAAQLSIHAMNTEPWMTMLQNGFVSFADPSDAASRIFVPNPPQDIEGYLASGAAFDLDQTTSVTQTWSDRFSLPAGHLTRSATIPPHDYTVMVGTDAVTQAAATTVTVSASISSPGNVVSQGGNNYALVPPTNPAYTTNPTYRELAENVRSQQFIDPLHQGTTTTSIVTVQYTPQAVYTRPEDGSTTSAIVLDSPSQNAVLTMTLEPWSGNAIASTAADVSSGLLSRATADELGIVARNALQSLAGMRATNGAEQSRLHFAKDMLSINRVNLESAQSRIVDVNVASESAQLAKLNILQQAGTAMMAQANQSAQSLLRLLAN